MTLDKLAEIKQLAQSQRKIEAIKLYRQTFNVGLKEAKDAVERLERGESLTTTDNELDALGNAAIDPNKDARVAEMMNALARGHKIEAIKIYRELFGVGLKEAKDAVEAIPSQSVAAATFHAAPESTPRFTPRPALTRLGCILAVLGFLAFLVVMIWGLTFRLSGSYRQALAAAQSNPRVIEWLGQPIEPSWWPITGQLSCGDRCNADYTIPIHGSHGSGYIAVHSYSRGASFLNEGEWILSAEVGVDNGGPTLSLQETPTPSRGTPEIDTTAVAEAQIRQATMVAQATATQKAVVAATGTAQAQVKATAETARQATATAEAALPLVARQKQWPVALADSFQDNRADWPTGRLDEKTFTAWRSLNAGQYTWAITPTEDVFWGTWPDKGQDFADFYASVAAQTSQTSGVAAYGLVFRVVDEQNFYYFGLYDDGYYRFVACDNGQPMHLEIGDSHLTLNPARPKRLAVSAHGPQFILLIDDHVVQVIEDKRFAIGKIGLGIDAFQQGGPAEVIFDNLEIRAATTSH